jgi:hypothetical protein
VAVSAYDLLLPFKRFLPGEEDRFHPMHIHFNAGLGARPMQAKTIAIQRPIYLVRERSYEGLITAIERSGTL